MRRCRLKEPEIARKQVEIERVDGLIVIPIALNPRRASAAEICRQGVEIDGIDRAVQIAVAIKRVAEQETG